MNLEINSATKNAGLIQKNTGKLDRHMKYYYLAWVLIIVSALCDSYAAFIIKGRMNQTGPIDFSSMTNFFQFLARFIDSPLVLTAVLTFCSAPVLWFLALQHIDFSLGYPALMSFHLVFAVFLGVCFLGEALTLTKGIGILLALSSLFFLFKPA